MGGKSPRRVVKVDLGERGYDILVGPGSLGPEAGRRIGRLGDRGLIVTNAAVDRLYGDRLRDGLKAAGVEAETLRIGDGEKYKTMAAVGKIHDRLVARRFDRRGMVIALGGGVTGDIAGFAAASYMRGVRFVQAPTTLLAQVDSSVGGKTGVNHPKGKNLIGAFHQPSLVVADTGTLSTLPKDEVLCGVAEVVKYGLIADRAFFGWLEKEIGALTALDAATVVKAVTTSCRIKAAVVGRDEREAGERAILNFGHTVGHAVEALTGYRAWKHGQAVAIGMRAAAELSRIKGGLTDGEVGRTIRLLEEANLPARLPKGLSDQALIKAMGHDKKALGATIRFVLLDGIGKAAISGDVTRDEIKEALARSRG
ncbi:MAG: 3-dehydroquinate synthase [Nitrospinae bacterium]|nr:3-dehydroquinate synthase [Nitrospinota bacterium]